jgi:hypothetical protein
MLKILLAGAVLLAAQSASAAVISHSAGTFGGALTPPFGGLTDAVGTSYIGSGVDYSFGNTEGTFNDGSALAFCGINPTGTCDLVTTVDAMIVNLGTQTQALTSYVWAEAGFAAAGSLTLSVFDILGNLIASATNDLPVGPNGRSTFAIDRGGVFDIASFSISGQDSFGVNTVRIEAPPTSAVPLPAALPMLASAFGLIGLVGWRRRTSA